MDEEEFNPYRDIKKSEEEIITFTHPKFLPNTAFIVTPPKPLLVMFRNMLDRFHERYDYSDDKVEKEMRGSRSVIKRMFQEGNDCQVSTIQRIIDDLHHYDKHYENRVKKRLYKAKKPLNITDNFIGTLELFCARHQISKTVGSNWAFGNPTHLKMVQDERVSLRVKNVDRISVEMHKIDKQHIKIMGDTYVRWKKYGQ